MNIAALQSHQITPNHMEEFGPEHHAISQIHKLKLLRIQSGLELFDFSMINPDIPPARFLIDKLVQSSLKSYNHRYGVSRGIKKLRESFAFKYASTFGVNLDPATEVCVSLGCKDATLHLLRILTDADSQVVVVKPTYPAYVAALRYLNSRYQEVDGSPDEAELLSNIRNAVSEYPTSVLLLNFPANPTGQLVSKNFWNSIVELSNEFKFTVVNDFVYGELGHEAKPVSFLSVPGAKEVGVEIYSLSKAYNIPGWRVAGVLGKTTVIEALGVVKSQVDYGMFLPVQVAAAAVLAEVDDLVSPVRSAYYRRLKVLSDGLISLGWNAPMPKAGACIWTKAPAQYLNAATTGGALYVAKMLLERSGIAVMPEEAFGQSGSGFLRFAAVMPEDKIRSAIDKLSDIQVL